MSLFGDLEKQVLNNVLGGSKQPSKKQTMKSSGNKRSNNNVKDTITNDLLGMATENIKKYTPDSIDKIVDDVAGTLSK